MIVRRTRETVLISNTIITCVVDETSVVGLEIDTVISCLDDCVEGFTPTPTLITPLSIILQTLITINDVNDTLIPRTHN